MAQQFVKSVDVQRFALAGRAVITLSSKKSGARYTFRIDADDDGERFFVKLLTGPNNTADYTYIGTIFGGKDHPNFRSTKKSPPSLRDAPSVKAIQFLCERVMAHPEAPMPPDLLVHHEGRCGRCGRTLTVPESIELGIGPECANKMGIG